MGPDIRNRGNPGSNQELPVSAVWHDILQEGIVWLQLQLRCVAGGCRLSVQHYECVALRPAEHDCITAYPRVAHKIEMCISREHQGAKITNKINVQCVWINEHVLRSSITWGNKKTAQPRFPWVIERSRGSYFYYLVGKKFPIFLSKFIKDKYVQVSRQEEETVCVANVENHSVGKYFSHTKTRSWAEIEIKTIFT